MLLWQPLKSNRSALRQHKKGKLKTRWKIEWEATTRADKYKDLDLSLPSNKFLKLISDNELSRLDTSRIFQLRSGHILLNGYLERFKRVDNARCPACGHPYEDVKHYLLDCPAYKHERWNLFKQCKAKRPKLKDLLNNSDLMIPLANYIQCTERFKQMEERSKNSANNSQEQLNAQDQMHLQDA